MRVLVTGASGTLAPFVIRACWERHEVVLLARSSGDDATIVRVIGYVSFALAVPALLQQALAWSAQAAGPGRTSR